MRCHSQSPPCSSEKWANQSKDVQHSIWWEGAGLQGLVRRVLCPILQHSQQPCKKTWGSQGYSAGPGWSLCPTSGCFPETIPQWKLRLWTQLPWGRERRWKNVTFTASHFWLQALFPQSLIHWTRKCFLAPIINMKGVDRALELWLERELGWRCRFPDGGVSLDVKTKGLCGG